MILQRPVQHVYPLEVCAEEVSDVPASELTIERVVDEVSPPTDDVPRRSRRTAVVEAGDRIYGCITTC